jgi:TonB family protein
MRYSKLLVLTLAIAPISLSASPIIYGTGVDNNGNNLPGGSMDPHYTISGPGIPLQQAIVESASSHCTTGPVRIPVGRIVQSAKVTKKLVPVYPSLARQARIQGTVRFTAIIGKDGTIQNLTLVSRHPLLVQNAQDAVKPWVYQPTLLNGEPVEVVTEIDVNFA